MDENQFQQSIQKPLDQQQPVGQTAESMASVKEPVVYLEPKPEPQIFEDRKAKGTDLGWKFLVGGFVFVFFLTFLGFAIFVVTPGKQRRTSSSTIYTARQSSGYKIPTPVTSTKTQIPQTEEEQAVQAVNVGNLEEDLQTLNNLMQEL